MSDSSISIALSINQEKLGLWKLLHVLAGQLSICRFLSTEETLLKISIDISHLTSYEIGYVQEWLSLLPPFPMDTSPKTRLQVSRSGDSMEIIYTIIPANWCG